MIVWLASYPRSGNTLFLRRACETVAWLAREMTTARCTRWTRRSGASCHAGNRWPSRHDSLPVKYLVPME